jgi:hypothetical protein
LSQESVSSFAHNIGVLYTDRCIYRKVPFAHRRSVFRYVHFLRTRQVHKTELRAPSCGNHANVAVIVAVVIIVRSRWLALSRLYQELQNGVAAAG